MISPTVNVGAGWTSFFTLSTSKVCGITECSIKAKGCKENYTGKNLVMGKRSPWLLKAVMNSKAKWEEEVCIQCENGSATKTVDNVKISQKQPPADPHPTMATVCDVGSDQKCVDLYGYKYCCMSIQALAVKSFHDQTPAEKARIAEFEASGYPTRVNQGRVLMCQNRPDLDHITTRPDIVAEITTMPITYQAYCAGAERLIAGGALLAALSLYL